MNFDDALPTFFVEAREQLQDMEAALLRIAGEDDTTESVNAIFRAAHTIKGSAGLFGLDALVAFAHVVESLLDEVRSGTIPLGEPLIELLLACADHIGRLVDAAESGGRALAAEDEKNGAALLERLHDHLGAGNQAPAAGPVVASADGDTARWHIALRFGDSVLRNGMDPLSFLRYLATLGTIEHIVTLHDGVPVLEALDAESCGLGFRILFASEAGRAAIENVFEFVIDDCELRVTPAPGIEAAPQAASPAHRATASAPAPKPPRDAKAPESQSVRVDADKLDRLINLVGELIIAAAGANLIARRTRHVELQESHATLSELVEEVRDSALQLRMVKIGATFGRFNRVVHDVARELGKDIALGVSGEDTELDKTVVEKIGDPLMHLVRNAMDHGIDAPELRAARGKPPQGTVALNAYHDSGSIVIQVSDDGGGLDRDRILAKAVERGLVEAGRSLSDAEIYALIFEPGFSTAAQVTNLSGRGVGMDVVKRNISALRGSVGIDSRPGQGTTVTVRLPLTLAIINGFQVGVGKSVFVVPLDVVDECVEFAAEADHDYIDLRGQVLPFIRLRTLFEVAGPPAARQNIVVVKHAGQKFGLVVDMLMGEAQTVIKPLSKMFAQVQGISGSSILGSGDVALILDVPMLMQQATRVLAATGHPISSLSSSAAVAVPA
ncbi:chemotaxis protein CheA [Variovorax sp. PBL-E5]|uniref:chemotaxis protein CheA n=1 Tax=Variovorax sp. PBL-E5 TaxID=434014 RepID=UPI0013167755|nr:chemotaxis protein CheA [Variovorax sp. PBL-E5]VTU33209.1 Chemotaxis protein CheA [Variovorax sp. PBL-E5]